MNDATVMDVFDCIEDGADKVGSIPERIAKPHEISRVRDGRN